eukprot:TRINITY_DN217_c3_g2_i1.p1 TRINITY_DN217_c3_g2~~TRINITY_DN217_c3_g2_i1.p1  ORF type:complete len:495 (+),score=111.49 TRINITY_DN217_c3_g2_i1:85-1569(+)
MGAHRDSSGDAAAPFDAPLLDARRSQPIPVGPRRNGSGQYKAPRHFTGFGTPPAAPAPAPASHNSLCKESATPSEPQHPPMSHSPQLRVALLPSGSPALGAVILQPNPASRPATPTGVSSAVKRSPAGLPPLKLPANAVPLRENYLGPPAAAAGGSLRQSALPEPSRSPAITAVNLPGEDGLRTPAVVGYPPASPSGTARSAAGGAPLQEVPVVLQRWAQTQRGMHTVEPHCTVVVEKSGQSAAARHFIILVFMMTQGSGKDKIFKLLQNVFSLVGSLSKTESGKARCFLAEDQLSHIRKGLRMFKSFGEISKILANDEKEPWLRYLMYFGNLSSFLYFLLDHVVGLCEMRIARASNQVYNSVKWWKNIFSLLRILTAFAVDSRFYRRAQAQMEAAEKYARERAPPGIDALHDAEYESALTEIRAADMLHSQLRRNTYGNVVNLSLLLSALGVPGFKRLLTPPLIALAGIFTASLGLYKLWRRIWDNQLTLQFC